MPGFTQWSPDTCDCVLEFNNDDGSYHGTVKICAKHAAVGGSAQHLANVLSHNQNKNKRLQELAEQFGLDVQLMGGGYDPAAPVGNDPILLGGVAGALAARGSAVTIPQAQAWLDQKYGAGIIRIVS